MNGCKIKIKNIFLICYKTEMKKINEIMNMLIVIGKYMNNVR